MKKILLSLICISLLLTGCSKGEENTVEEKTAEIDTTNMTEEEKGMYEFLTDNILTTQTSAENRFFVFTKDGKYLRYYGSEVIFDSGNVYFTSGTYEYKDKVLTVHLEKYFGLEPDGNGNYVVKEQPNVRDEVHNDFYIVRRQSSNGERVYAGITTFRLEKANEKVPQELYDYMKKCLENDFKDFSLEKAKSLEVPFD
jgi:hypothetical protein